MTPVLRDLHWLPVRQRIDHIQDGRSRSDVQVLHDMASQYLQTYCKPVSTCTDRRLRSATSPIRSFDCSAVIAVSPSMDLVHGTVLLLNCVQWTRLTRSDINWVLIENLRFFAVFIHPGLVWRHRSHFRATYLTFFNLPRPATATATTATA